MEENEPQDPAFLESLRSRATRFSLRDGESASVNLRLVQR